MDIFLTNTLTRKKEKFEPIEDKKVGIYTCGPTVYRDIHIGNLRTYIAADLLKRTLLYNGLHVTHVKNITDVGHMRMDDQEHQIDPVIAEALKEGKSPSEIAEKYTKQFLEDEKKVNIIPADHFPKATEYLEEMIKIIKTLLEKGFAYETDGTVYFDVKKFRDYGKLSGNTLDKMDKLLEAVRVSSETDKKDSADFALWKKAESGRMMKWSSPWGEGFPGWHIECSAMSMKHLGETFDIHTGGEDLVFPHHEDEIAQSESATGKKFARYWFHSGFLVVDRKKMARREGNVYTISEIQKKGFNPLSFRYLVLTAHYKSRLNFTWDSLKAAETTLNSLYSEISGFASESEAKIGCAEYENRFLEAINDDLDMPKALSIVWEMVRSNYPAGAKLRSLLKFDRVLGFDLAKMAEVKLPGEVVRLLEERETARNKKDFKKSDQIREEIEKKGFEVEDTSLGPRVKKIISKN